MSQETECKIKKVADTSLLDDGDCPKDPALPNVYGLGLARGALNPVCVLPELLEVSKGCYGLYNVVKLPITLSIACGSCTATQAWHVLFKSALFYLTASQ